MPGITFCIYGLTQYAILKDLFLKFNFRFGTMKHLTYLQEDILNKNNKKMLY